MRELAGPLVSEEDEDLDREGSQGKADGFVPAPGDTAEAAEMVGGDVPD